MPWCRSSSAIWCRRCLTACQRWSWRCLAASRSHVGDAVVMVACGGGGLAALPDRSLLELCLAVSGVLTTPGGLKDGPALVGEMA